MSNLYDPYIESGESDLDYYERVNGRGDADDDWHDRWCKGGSEQYTLQAKQCFGAIEAECAICGHPLCEQHAHLCESKKCLNSGKHYCWRCSSPVADYRLCHRCVKNSRASVNDLAERELVAA
jgi:hypothetical protein